MSTASVFATVGRCEVHPTADICDGAVIGKRFRRFLDGSKETGRKTVIGAHAYVGYYAIIGNGSNVYPRAVIDDFSVIESRVTIGSRTLVIYRAQICNDARVGDECVVGGFVGERSIIGRKCRVFGKLVHLQHEPHRGWDDDTVLERSPRIEDGAFIGFGAVVAGGVTVGKRAYICAGALVTRDVPERHVAAGMNCVVHFSEWRGPLKDSKFFIGKIT